jgi:hypothetical protein
MQLQINVFMVKNVKKACFIFKKNAYRIALLDSTKIKKKKVVQNAMRLV